MELVALPGGRICYRAVYSAQDVSFEPASTYLLSRDAPTRLTVRLPAMCPGALQVSFEVVKLVFALSAAPFFCFTLGPVGKIFSHADPTAYTRSGRLAQTDTTGLSAYLVWLKADVLESERWRQELE